MRVLGIETSCDETGIAIYDDQQGLLANQLYSQVKLHADYGGVVPELASRDHVRKTVPLIQAALKEAGLTAKDIDAVAYTAGPGLVGALLVGATVGRSLAFAWNVPAIPVHHMEGHLLAPMLEDNPPAFPFVALLVSGGHTQLISVTGIGQYELLGESIDDAAGEAFDKAARVLSLPYPGGPRLDKLAEEGDPYAMNLPMPHPEGRYDFSFSGLKTAFLNAAHKMEQKGEELPRADMAASFRRMVCTCLSDKAVLAAQETHAKALAMAGGVSANSLLRRMMQPKADIAGIPLYMPRIDLCTDNAAMIGSAAYYRYRRGEVADLTLNAVPGLRLL